MHSNLTRALAVGVLALAAVGSVTPAAAAQAAETPTFSKDVAPILFENCVTCHRPGEIAPMSLLTYQDARPWSRAIKVRVTAGEMPPWHADPAHGRFLNERRLSDADRDILVRWVDAGAPEGDPRDLPPRPEFAEGWGIGAPDVVISMQKAYDVPAEGEVKYQYFTTPTNFTEDQWVQAIEARPGTRTVVHHILVYAREPGGRRSPAFRDVRVGQSQAGGGQPGGQTAERSPGEEREPEGSPGQRVGNLIATYAPGTNPMVFQPRTAMRIEAGSTIVFQVHYTTNGEATSDVSSVGMVLAGQPSDREMRVGQFINARFVIPPGAANARVDSEIVFTEDAHIWALFPHTHLRGKSWEYRIVYPDGRSDVVLAVPKYDFNWQTYYLFAEPLAAPKGTRLQATAHYDNSAANRANPDPTVAVRWGDQTWEEMQYSGITYTVDTAATASVGR